MAGCMDTLLKLQSLRGVGDLGLAGQLPWVGPASTRGCICCGLHQVQTGAELPFEPGVARSAEDLGAVFPGHSTAGGQGVVQPFGKGHKTLPAMDDLNMAPAGNGN
jgi:hypothetical protein